jgi:toxin CcdB
VAPLVIRQYDAFRNPGAATRAKVPYVVVLQSHLFEALPTVVIAPLMRLEQSARNSKVLVEVEFAGESLVVNAAFLGNIERRVLGRSRGSLAVYEDDIRRAIDRLFTGF